MGGTYLGLVPDLSSLDLEEIAGALADQTDYEHHWLISPDTELARTAGPGAVAPLQRLSSSHRFGIGCRRSRRSGSARWVQSLSPWSVPAGRRHRAEQPAHGRPDHGKLAYDRRARVGRRSPDKETSCARVRGPGPALAGARSGCALAVGRTASRRHICAVLRICPGASVRYLRCGRAGAADTVQAPSWGPGVFPAPAGLGRPSRTPGTCRPGGGSQAAGIHGAGDHLAPARRA